MSLIDPLLDRIQDIKASMSGQLVLRWGTVTQADPLRVRLDADADPLPFKPLTLVAGLDVGDRVQVALQNRRATVLGRGGGNAPDPAPVPGTITASVGTTIDHQLLVKNPDGTVEIYARFTRGSNMTNTQALGQLPSGFWPANLWVLPGTVAPGTAQSSALRIGTDGALSYVGSTAGTSMWVSGRFPLT